MFPFSSALCAQQRVQYVGSTAAQTDASGNATLALPAGTSVGDLLIFHVNGSGGTVGGGGTGSWTASTSAQVFYKRVVTLTSVTLTGGSSSSDSALLLTVVRGATALGTAVSGGVGGTYPNLTLAGITKSSAALGFIWFLASSAGNDGASAYTMTSPTGALVTARSGAGPTVVAGFVELNVGNYVSAAAATITATGGSAGTSYNTSVAFQLQ